MQTLIQSAIHPLLQLQDFLNQVNEPTFSEPKEILFASTLGMHVRHIIEFYQCLLNGLQQGEMNYDARERNMLLETNIDFAKSSITEVCNSLRELFVSKTILLQQVFLKIDEPSFIPSSAERELAYVIEHTIHHLAIIKMACLADKIPVVLHKDFGVAYSTIIHREHVYSQLPA
jgi:uncharacterized damage-inducible protein DinB